MTEDVKITFYPSKITGVIPKRITILDAARSLGVDIEGPCGGTGKCGRDLVQIRKEGILHTVLACKTPVEADLEVVLPSHEKKALKIVEGFYAKHGQICDIDPSVRKELMYNEHGLCFTNVYANDDLLFVEHGNTKDQSYGIAIDIGTTTLVVSLVDLNSGAVLNSSSMLNPLVYYGHDVMSRIKYAASHQDGLLRMHRELIAAINLLIHGLSSERSVRPDNIYQIIAAGNTTMQHIFLNKEIAGIGEYPYQAETLDICTTTAQELSINIASKAPVTAFPCISAYVGGDIVSGLLAIDVKSIEVPALFLDIGTNGEIALILNDSIVASSTAAGPCFEGMTISSGMRAGEGAIEHVRFEEELSLEIIGGGQPKGICGSGLLDLVSELVRTGLVNSRGRLQSPDCMNNIMQQSCDQIPSIKWGEGGCKDSRSKKETLRNNAIKYKKNLFEKDGKRHFRLTDTISISQEDIRQVQLAKAAIKTGIEILLAECNIKAEELKAIIIAGGFGYHLNEKSLFGIGLLPEATNARLSFVGNSSLEGAVRVLLDKKLVNNAVQIARTAQVMELSQIPDFEGVFVREMHF
ncbi:MAG: ASKHA domain-containing protein [Candidatus Brocadia sp.]